MKTFLSRSLIFSTLGKVLKCLQHLSLGFLKQNISFAFTVVAKLILFKNIQLEGWIGLGGSEIETELEINSFSNRGSFKSRQSGVTSPLQ